MYIKIANSLKATPDLAIVGHVGCGHAHSHLGFVQDDSGGFAAVTNILKRATHIDLTITEVVVQAGLDGRFTVLTASGGEGTAIARRGITPQEKVLAQRVVGEEAICTQALAVKAYGRILGQGAMEVPVALQTAIANAAIDSFKKSFPDKFLLVEEEIDGNCGKILGTKLQIDDYVVSILDVVNATIGGLGPNEDIEGNVNLAGKKAIMDALGMANLPTLLIEGKVCSNPVSQQIQTPTFLVRAFPHQDNTIVARCYEKAGKELGLPIEYREELLARSNTSMRNLTQSLGEKITELGQQLQNATTALDKVRIAAELNALCSQDLGGITFMSEDIHHVMGGVGMIPGTCACLSLFIPAEQLRHDVIPSLTYSDVENFSNIILLASHYLYLSKDLALKELENNQKTFDC